MASPNTNYTDLITTTLEFMGDEIVDAVTGNNAGTAWLKSNDGYKVIEGGEKIAEPLAYAQNPNGGWYGPTDELPTGIGEEFTAAEFPWKLLAVPIVSTGLELEVQNVGKARRFELIAERIKNAKRTAANIVATGFYSDGTGAGGKQLTGLLQLASSTPTAGTYGGLARSSGPFWQNKFTDTGGDPAAATIGAQWNTMYYSLVRGADKPNLVLVDSDVMGAYEASLQTNQRFTDTKMAALGFENLKYKGAVVVMDGNCTDKTAYFLNTDFMRIRVAQNRNFKTLPKRSPYNQDVEVVMLVAALNLTCSWTGSQGRIEHKA